MKVLERLGLKVEAAKQVGTLYHLTNIDGMEFILRGNKLKVVPTLIFLLLEIRCLTTILVIPLVYILSSL